jgi:Raf kinase inhibitor-like YbhB/YbcL family protein
MKRIVYAISFFVIVLGFYLSHDFITQNISTLKNPSVTMIPNQADMKITSTAFADNTSIPVKYSCDGKGVNPPLDFLDIPKGTKSLALLVDDPDVPKNLLPAGVFDHWVIYNIEPTVSSIKEESIPPGVQGLNGSEKIGYTPPCPPDRQHRYFFKLYALDSTLSFPDASKVNKKMVIDAMRGHIIEEAELIGLYNRSGNK